ncbi:DMT family transporter [Pseudomonas sp. SIMBA_077]
MQSTSNLHPAATEKNLWGWINGFIGVVIFSASLPATRVAVQAFDPVFLTFARASIAGVLALCILALLNVKRPERSQLLSLLIVAIGVVVGFPLLTALALQHVSSAHSIIFLGLLPLCTAAFGVLRAGEHPRPTFWLFSVLGSALVIAFALSQGLTASPKGDVLMLLAVLICGLGYAEGAKLSKTLGGWQVISWALALSLPLMGALAWLSAPASFAGISPPAWFSLAYISLFSMLIGFFFWYRGLAQGGIAAVSQLQLLQPFFGLTLAATFLHESVTLGMFGITGAVVICVAAAKKFAM